MMDLPHDVTFDIGVRYVDRLAMPPPFTPVRSYVTMDARLAWHVRKNVELSVVGQSLLQNRHAEFSPTAILANPQTDVPRSVYGKITWQF
jgi:iron complex outermembrane recepter protein